MQHKKVIKTVLYGMVILFFVSVITDFVDVKRNEVYARNPEKSFDTYEDKIYLELLNNK